MSTTEYFPSFQLKLIDLYTSTKDKLVVPRAYGCYVKVVSGTFPVTWYNVPAGRNVLNFSYLLNGEDSRRTFTFTVPPAQYSASQLASVCTWNGYLPGLPENQFSFGCVFQSHLTQFQLLFRVITQVMSFKIELSDLAYSMGFTGAQETFHDPFYPLALSCLSDQCCDLLGVRNINVYSNLKVRQLNTGTRLLAVIPVNDDSLVRYDGSNSVSFKMYDNIIGDIELQLLDDAARPINFNGVPWSIVLQFDFHSPDPNPRIEDETESELNITSK